MVLGACSSKSSNEEPSSNVIVNGEFPFNASGESLSPSKALEDLNLENVIKIEYKNGSVDIDNPYEDNVSIDKTGENVVVTINSDTEYSFVLSGTAANGSLKFYGDVRKKLYLNGLNITNNSGPAINIQKSGRIIVHLLNGKQNFLADGSNYNNIPNGEQAKGAFFSEGKLHFEGSGSLEVKGKYNHAIVVDNDFQIDNGKIIVKEAVGDGIHANDKIEIIGGVLEITSTGDAIQSENPPPEGTNYEWVKIFGGKIKALTTGVKSHGVVSEGGIKIDSVAIIQISVLGNGSKGIKSSKWLDLFGGKTSIKASGTKHANSADPEDESSPAGIKLDGDLFMEGGELTIKSPGSGAKGINAYNANISDGKIDIDADGDGVKVHGKLTISGGSGSIKSKKKDAIDGENSIAEGTVTIKNGGY